MAFGVWKAAEKRMDLTVQTIGADGSGRMTLTGTGRIWATPFDSGSWSPDGTHARLHGGAAEG